MRVAPKKLGRRELGRAALGAGVGLLGTIGTPGCTGAVMPPKPPAPVPPLGPAAIRDVEVWSVFDLPADDLRSRELSGAAWDAETRTLWAVQDELAAIIPLRPDAAFRTWSFGDAVKLQVTGALDLEGIAIAKDGFILASEIGPRLIEIDRQGRHRRDVSPPAKFMEALRNKSFESLALDPDRNILYTTSETALPRDDGASNDGAGPRVRIVRKDLTSGDVKEHAYATDAVVTGGGDYGVSDLTALALDDLLVLERGFRKGIGNSIRIYRVDLSDPASVCEAVEKLAPDAPVLPKKLVVDLSKLPPSGASAPKQPQPTALMENYEGLTIGPRLPDGRRSLFLVSDDNGRAVQTPRVLTLALR